MSKRVAALLAVSGVMLVAIGFLKHDWQPPPAPEPPVPTPKRAEPEDAAGVAVLAAIRAAEQTADPVARCRAVPPPRGWNWSAEMVEAFCLDYHTPRLSGATLLSMFRDGEFDKIDRHFEEVADAFHAGRMPEGVYWFSYSRQFWATGSDATTFLEAWVKALPRSPHAQLALAMHRTANAWGWRTEKRLADVPKADLRRMAEEVELARAAAEAAIGLDPRTLPAYAVLISLSMIGVPDEVAAKAARDAFAQRPDTFYVREAMMTPAWPMWGGSVERMQAIADEAAPHVASNPRLASLQAMAKGYGAMERFWEDDDRQASRLYDQALAHGIDWTFIDQADKAFANIGDTARAVEIVTQQLRFNPGNLPLRNRRAKWLVKLKQDDWALAEFEAIAAAGGANNQQLVNDHVWALIQLGRDDEAIARLVALRTGTPDSRWADLALARQYLYRKRDFPAAGSIIDELLRSDPEDGAAWLLRTDYLQNTNAGEAAIREAATQFVRHADASESEQRTALPKVQGWLQRAAMPVN